MITIGVYPRMFHDHGGTSDIAAVSEWLSASFPPAVGAHILPFWVSEGDGGFALSSWTDVDSSFGSIDDLKNLCASRSTFIDGIYNHVGWHHPIARQFLSNPDDNAGCVTAIKASSPPTMPPAPRGGPLYRPCTIGEYVWQVRQTFSQCAVDISVHEPAILQHIFDHLLLLSRLGAKGVRLDAVEYYGRHPTDDLMNNPDGIAVATTIANRAAELGLEILLQMDFDSRISHYRQFERHRPIIVDYSYPCYVVHAFLTGSTSRLAAHLGNTAQFGRFRIQRPVRTHDGVLMRSVHQPPEFLSEIVDLFERKGFFLRYTNGTLYECNNSLPMLLEVDESAELYYRKIGAALVVAELSSDSSYIYAGSLLGDVPEHERRFGDDPRELQRRSVPLATLKAGPWANAGSLRQLIRAVATHVVGIERSSDPHDLEIAAEDGALYIARKSLGLSFVANFTPKSKRLRDKGGDTIAESGAVGDKLGAYGYRLERLKKERL